MKNEKKGKLHTPVSSLYRSNFSICIPYGIRRGKHSILSPPQINFVLHLIHLYILLKSRLISYNKIYIHIESRQLTMYEQTESYIFPTDFLTQQESIEKFRVRLAVKKARP